jgi:ferredoxin
MDNLRRELIEAGVSEQRIHWESFGSALHPQAVDRAEPCESLSVSFVASDVQASWIGSDQSLWELAREHQVEIPSGCLSGVCGCCRVKLLSGTVCYDREITLELADDECLACIARPKTDCCIDA